MQGLVVVNGDFRAKCTKQADGGGHIMQMRNIGDGDWFISQNGCTQNG